jgi:rhamnulokinase
MAAQCNPSTAYILPDDPRFREPGSLPEKIAAACRETGQPAPVSPGEYVRIILESLALAHAETLGQLEAITGQEIEVLHVVGRGAQNGFLNQLVADTTGLPVIVGSADAAAIGNILIQALALWHLKSPDHLRSIVATSFPAQILKPDHRFDKKARDRFRLLSERHEQAEPLAA